MEKTELFIISFVAALIAVPVIDYLIDKVAPNSVFSAS